MKNCRRLAPILLAISVRFLPVMQGTKSARITIVDDVMGSPHEIPMVGIGGPPQPAAH